VRRDGWYRVTAGDSDSPQVGLDQDRAVVPGKRAGGRWAITRAWGTYLCRRLVALSARHCEVEVAGGSDRLLVTTRSPDRRSRPVLEATVSGSNRVDLPDWAADAHRWARR
jgi:hypothetical protein